MLASSVSHPFDSDRHLFEPKWDGYRCLAFLRGGQAILQSRNLRDITLEFPQLADLARFFAVGEAVVDGEITAWEGGRPSFSALQGRRGQVTYVVFDMLARAGEALLDRPLEERRRCLEEALVYPDGHEPGAAPTARPLVILSPAIPTQGRELFAAAARLGLEGVMAKEVGSPYLPGQRSRYWLKVKVRRAADVVIVGYRLAPGGSLGSLALAVADDGDWRIIGHVGTGWDKRSGQHLLHRLRQLETAAPPAPVPPDLGEGVTWVEPTLVCSVSYLELTPEGRLRHTSFLGLRPDLDPRETKEGEHEGRE